jgi:DUF1680 family protein
MKKVVSLSTLFVVTGVLTLGSFADVPRLPSNKLKVENKAPIKAYAFDLRDVRVLEGPFKHAQELDHKYLLNLDADRLLHTFRLNAGLPSSAQPLGGWEEPKGELRGHSIGHYLSACAMMYASTDDAKLKEKANYIVAELAKCQDKIGTGYLSAYPEEFFDRVESGRRVWAPWYTMHKIYAGLLDVYVYCDNQQALEVAKKFADWAKARTDKLSDEQMQRMLNVEHGGMNDALAELYALTGDEKYLKLSQRFNHQRVLGPLSKREDPLTGLHANTQFPKVIGVSHQYELTADESLHTTATYFWDVVTKERSYVIGGNSDGEMFTPKEKLSTALGPNTTETCNTYNMLKLTRHLFCWEPKAEYADYYERGLYNHILASQNPENGMMCYYVPLRTGSRKNFSDENDSFWCCVGTGMENHAKYGDSIYFHDGKGNLYLNLFIASELNHKAKGIKIRQQTEYPMKSSTRLILTCEKPVQMTLNIRHPYWAVKGIVVLVNAEKQSINSIPGSYVAISRTWKTSDTVDITMPMTLRAEAFRDNPRRMAFMYGPLVLCAEMSPDRQLPALVAEDVNQVLSSITPVTGKPATFTGSAKVFRSIGADTPGDMTLMPFYQVYTKPYVVYWDMLNEDQWKTRQEQYKAEQARVKELDGRTVDRVLIGRRQSEKEHAQRGENTEAGNFDAHWWRHATDGGWFSYELKVIPNAPADLLVAYWGSDGGREFDILVDGTKVATQKLENNKPGEFFDVVYPLSAEMTKDKEKVTVRFQALPGRMAGGVFDCRILRR